MLPNPDQEGAVIVTIKENKIASVSSDTGEGRTGVLPAWSTLRPEPQKKNLSVSRYLFKQLHKMLGLRAAYINIPKRKIDDSSCLMENPLEHCQLFLIR